MPLKLLVWNVQGAKSRIMGIEDDMENWMMSLEDIKQITISFFKSLLTLEKVVVEYTNPFE